MLTKNIFVSQAYQSWDAETLITILVELAENNGCATRDLNVSLDVEDGVGYLNVEKPETPAETEERERAAEQAQRRFEACQKERELELFNSLKKKYEKPDQ